VAEPIRAVHDLLSATPAVTALVDVRIYPVQTEQDAPNPKLMYSLNDAGSRARLSSVRTLNQIDFRVEIHADDDADRDAIAGAVKTALDGYRGGRFQYCFFTSESDDEVDDRVSVQQYRAAINN
jgi:Protein of unknown function (DUF3168)